MPASQHYPTSVGVETEPTFWGYSAAAVSVYGSKLTASIPRSAKPGAKLSVTGTAVQVRRACDPVPCWPYEMPDAGRVLTLQARLRAGASWTTVATTKATSKGAFTFPGTRDYRVIAAPVSYPSRSAAGLYAATSATTTRAVAPGSPGGNGNGGGTGGFRRYPRPSDHRRPILEVAAAGGMLVLLGVIAAMAGRVRRRPS